MIGLPSPVTCIDPFIIPSDAILEETILEGGNGKVAIIPQIEGSACITQYSEIVIDPLDPFPNGYRVADIW